MPESISTIFLLLIILSITGLITWFAIEITKEKINLAFPETYEDVKLFFGNPKEKFTARMVTAGNMQFRGFYATVYVFEKTLIIRHSTRAILVKDISKLKLSGEFVSTLTVENEVAPLKLTLNSREYDIIKEFLEANNG